MKNHNKTQFISLKLFFITLCICIFGSCIEKYEGEELPPVVTGVGNFDFATTADFNLSVNYGIAYPILFEVYATNPMQVIDDGEIKNESIEPIFRAITDEKGIFNGPMLAPTSTKDVYLYTSYMGVPSLVPLQVANKTITFDITVAPALVSRAATTRAGVIGNSLLTIDTWNTLGTPDHLLPRIPLDGELINNIMYTLPESFKNGIGGIGDPNNLIKENESIGDIRILKNTKVNLIFMHEGAAMTSTLSYYCYPTDTPPTTIDELTRIVAIPNFSYAYSGGELSSGDRIQLKYWNGTAFVEEFPAGVSIGWSLIASGFIKETAEVNPKSFSTFYSNPAFNQEPTKKQHCVALLDKNRKVVALGFEDQIREKMENRIPGDNDFNDMVYYVETDVEGGINTEGIPEIIPAPTPGPNPEDNKIIYNGSLAFEDLWPSEGDYDMNDFVIDYSSTHYRDSKNQIIKIVDKFTPKYAGSGLANGFGYQLGVTSNAIRSVNIESDYDSQLSLFKTDGKGLELKQKKATIMLFENTKTIMSQSGPFPNTSKSFTVTVEFNSPVTSANLTLPPYNPFIVCALGGANGQRGVEVHLTNKAPTDLVDPSLFGTKNDKSDPSKGVYYISNMNYMFALNLPVTFDFPSEKQRLDQAYSRYNNWVKTNGTADADWYTDKKNN